MAFNTLPYSSFKGVGMKANVLIISLFVISSILAQESADKAPIIVQEKRLMSPAESMAFPEKAQGKNYSDGGDFLRSLPGVTGSRFGGHGVEPVIRGQSQDQLNVTLDDAFIFGGCPNRMDPPSAYANVSRFDEVIITKGYQSVLNGPGASGGSVKFKKSPPRLEGKKVKGLFETQYDSNSNQSDIKGHLTTGSSQYYLSANGSHRYANNYDDGDGLEVRSSFEENSYGLTVGATPNNGDHYKLSVQKHEVLNALFPGAGMDSPFSETTNISLHGSHRWSGGALKKTVVNVYSAQVDHQMDNYSLRPPGTSLRRVDSTSDTVGFKVKNDLSLGGLVLENTLEYRENERDAARYQGSNATNVSTLQSSMWPGITIAQYGVAFEGTKKGDKTKFVTGIRADFYEIDYAKADITSTLTNRSANDLYRQFYGYGSQSKDETNIGGLLRIEQKVGESVILKAGISRSVRSADATERGLANDMVMMGNNRSWVGNPNIEPEKHHQLDIAATYQKSHFDMGLSLYYNKVSDYILRDSARGQAGILINSNAADVYTNIDAYLAGAEFESRYVASSWAQLYFNFFYTYGKNETYDMPLAQIPALQGTLSGDLNYADVVTLTPELEWAFKQTRVDSNAALGSGRDVRATPGYSIFNLKVAYEVMKKLKLTLAANNIFDRKYANHLNRSNISDATEVQVFEPGRFFVAGLNYQL